MALQSTQPFVKWVGGKRNLLDQILPRLPEKFNTYYEPLVGGGAVYFSIAGKVKKSILADTNLDLVLTYKAIQKDPQKLISRLKYHARNHNEDHFYSVREKQKRDPIGIATRFLYLNKTCYNGLYRVNRSGKFNVPIGRYKNPGIVLADNILGCHRALKNTTIHHSDFETINPKKDDFVYFDPPYYPINGSSFTQYTSNGFSEKEQIRLRNFIEAIHRKGVKVMLSNSNTEFIKELYKGKYFKKHLVKAPRFVNSKANQRGNVEELLITNYETRKQGKFYR